MPDETGSFQNLMRKTLLGQNIETRHHPSANKSLCFILSSLTLHISGKQLRQRI